MLALAYTYAKNLQLYGEDVTKVISTATQNVAILEKAYNKGYYDAMNRMLANDTKGHWIQQPRYDGDDQPDLVCPNCGFKISWWDMGNFCAKCGTRLEGGAG